MKVYTVVTGNGSTFVHVAESIERVDNFFNFIVDGKVIGVTSTYGVVSISDQPYNQRYVR